MTPFDIVNEHKPLYRPSAKHPAIVEVPELAFLTVEGRGDPETSQAFHDAMQALYGTAYTLKFTLKKTDPERDFKVAPLEGLWWADEDAPTMAGLQRDRDAWNWKLMIAVPDAVTAEEVAAAHAAAARKRDLAAAPPLRLERFEEGLAAQIMHVGPYAEEAPTIERLHAFAAAEGYDLRGRHHEIYLGDPRRTAPERLKTVLRHPVAPAPAHRRKEADMEYVIQERELAPVLALVHHRSVTMDTIAGGLGAAFRVLVEHAGETGARWAGPPFVLYPEVSEGEFEMAVCMPVVPGARGGETVALEEVPGGRVAATLHVGPYAALHNAYAALQKWMADNGRTPSGPVREVYLNDPDAVPPEELQTEIDWPVT